MLRSSRSAINSLSAHRTGHAAATTADARPFGPGEALVVARDEVRLDLLHGVERDADDDHERGAAEAERHA